MIALPAAALALALAQTPAPAAPAPAAAAPAAPATLTLPQALDAAERGNLDLKVAAARLRQAEQGLWKAWSGYLPQVTLGGSYTRSAKATLDFPVAASPTPTPSGPLAGTYPFVTTPYPVVPEEQFQGTVDATQMIFSPAIYFGTRAASHADDAARSGTENARRQVLFGTAQAYYGVAALRQAAQVNERLLEIAQRQEKDARVRHQAGTIAKVALLRAEIDRARAEQDLLRARNAYQSARLGLANLLDRPADFDVVDPEEPRLPPDGGKLVEAALRDRADLASARAALEAARSAQTAQWSTYLPNVAAFGHYQNADKGGLTGKELWSVGLSAKWTILDGGLREASIRETNAKVAEAEAALRSAEAKVRLDVQQSLLDLDSARANAAKAREQRELAAENQRLVDVAFRAGAATAVEQADATAQLRTAEIAQQAEALGAQLAALRVLQSAGASLR